MSNTKKTLLLGESFGSASHKLRKAILFDLVQKLNKDICYRCSLKINTVDELSIEHTENWQSAQNPVEVFYDVKKIAFSHLSCNVRAAAKTWKKYPSKKEQKRAAFARYYERNKVEVLRKKRERYKKNQELV